MSGNLHDAVKQGDLGKEPRGLGEENEVPGKPIFIELAKTLRRSVVLPTALSSGTSSKSRRILPRRRRPNWMEMSSK